MLLLLLLSRGLDQRQWIGFHDYQPPSSTMSSGWLTSRLVCSTIRYEAAMLRLTTLAMLLPSAPCSLSVESLTAAASLPLVVPDDRQAATVFDSSAR